VIFYSVAFFDIGHAPADHGTGELIFRLRCLGNSSRDEAGGSVIRKMNGLVILPPFNGYFPLWRQK
jgi:hypothetical protein